MIQKSFSEGIYLEKEGPRSSTVFKTSCNRIAEKSYCTSVLFVPKLVPKRTYYTADSNLTSAVFNRACSLSNGEKSYESSVSLEQTSAADNRKGSLKFECDLPYFQNIELEPRLVMKEYSETINNFPKVNDYAYSSSVLYDPCHTKENYIVGLEVQKVREVTLSGVDDEYSGVTSSMHIAVPEISCSGKGAINGDCDSSNLLNGI